MKCSMCGSKNTKTQRENVPWREVPGVVVIDVAVMRCGDCGERFEEFRAIEALIAAIAQSVVTRAERITAAEIRFLRGFLGLNGNELARAIASSPSTVSRWEKGQQPVGIHAELLLRAMVLLHLGVKTAPGQFESMARQDAEVNRVRFAYRAGKWQQQATEKVAA
jgi:putative zinc finger/helix-turn-helix YgiT family protein